MSFSISYFSSPSARRYTLGVTTEPSACSCFNVRASPAVKMPNSRFSIAAIGPLSGMDPPCDDRLGTAAKAGPDSGPAFAVT